MEREREIDVEAVEGEDEKEDLPWLRIDQTWENVEEDLKNVSQNKDRLLKRRYFTNKITEIISLYYLLLTIIYFWS
jgi:hypothetical protein